MARLLFLLSVAVCSGFGFSAARADLPLPADVEYIKPTIQFVGVDDYRDYVFQIRYRTYHSAPFGPHHSTIVTGHPFQFNVERRVSDFQLLAIKREDYRKLPREEGFVKLTDKTEGVLSVKLHPPATSAKKSRTSAPIHQYKVEINDGKLIAEVPPKEGAGEKGWLPIVGGLFLSGGMILLGLRVARRTSQHSPVATIAPSSPA